MVEWKKDIKLSNLLARRTDDPELATSEEATPFESESPQADERRHEEPGASVLGEDVESDADAQPFWKRDLSFRRSRDVERDRVFDEPSDEKESFFKRELSFRRRSDQPADEPFSSDDSVLDPVAADVEPEETEKKSLFKRELGFGRRRGESAAEPFETERSEEVSHSEVAEVEAEESNKKSFFTRELSFRRRRDESWSGDAGPDEFVDAEASDESEETTDKKPFFRRELSFGRPREEAVDEQFTAEPHAEEQPEETESAEKTPFWKRELSFKRSTEEVDEVESDYDQAGSESEKTPFFKRELTFRRAKDEPADEPFLLDTPADQPEGAFPTEDALTSEEDVPAADELEQEQPEPHLADSTDPATAAPGASEAPEPAPVMAEVPEKADEFEPVAFADLTPEDSPTPGHDEPLEASGDERKPFWKRELSFGRRQAETEADFEVPAPRKAFFKKQFSFDRRQEDLDEPKSEKKPFFKRELRLPFGNRESAEAQLAPVTTRETRVGRKKDLIGLKIGASQIAAARVVNNGSPQLVQVARQPIEQGIVVGGELRDPEALADALRDFFAKNKLPGRNVRLGIGNNRIGVRSMEISGVHDPKQLENAIRYRAQEALPIPLDEAVLDYHVVEESTSQTGIRTYRVLLVVAYRELIDRYSAACRSAGLKLVGIDLEAFALLRALSPPAEEGFPEDTALVVVSIGHDRSTFAVSNGTVCEFTRVLDWGGSSLNTAIARALDLTPSQAEPLKHTLTLNPEERDAGTAPDEHTAMAEEAVRLELQSFARELVSSLHFYQNQSGSLAIGSIVLTGGSAHLPGLAAELQRLIGVKIRVGDPLRRVKTGKRVDSPDQLGSLAIAIGLGIED